MRHIQKTPYCALYHRGKFLSELLISNQYIFQDQQKYTLHSQTVYVLL